MTRARMLACAVLLMAACENPSSQWTAPEAGQFLGVEGLKDCRYFPVDTGVVILRVIRCPNSVTAVRHSCGKRCTQEAVVLDGGADAEAR